MAKDSYYKDKAKDSKEQVVVLLWLIMFAIIFGACYCTYQHLTHKCPEQTAEYMMESGGPK